MLGNAYGHHNFMWLGWGRAGVTEACAWVFTHSVGCKN
jgi:hypothetical protein